MIPTRHASRSALHRDAAPHPILRKRQDSFFLVVVRKTLTTSTLYRQVRRQGSVVFCCFIFENDQGSFIPRSKSSFAPFINRLKRFSMGFTCTYRVYVYILRVLHVVKSSSSDERYLKNIRVHLYRRLCHEVWKRLECSSQMDDDVDTRVMRGGGVTLGTRAPA